MPQEAKMDICNCNSEWNISTLPLILRKGAVDFISIHIMNDFTVVLG